MDFKHRLLLLLLVPHIFAFRRYFSKATTTPNNNDGGFAAGFDPPDKDDDSNNKDDSNPHPDLHPSQTHPLLTIPCSLQLDDKMVTLRTCLDTGAQRTLIQSSSLPAFGWTQLDNRYIGTATSVSGSIQVLGRLPAGWCMLQLGDTVLPSPAMYVLDDDDTTSTQDDHPYEPELLIGLDFLRDTNAVIDMGKGEVTLTIGGRKVTETLIRPRNEICFQKDDDDDDDEDDDEDFNPDDGKRIDMSGL